MPYSVTFYPGSWAERAREYVLTRTVPPTDSECDFNWTRLRCEPKCLCGSRLRFGDYTPGRSCRLLHPWERSPDCENAWDPSDEPAFRRLGAAAEGTLRAMKRVYDSRVAPPTDPECRFDLETMRCEPRPACHLRFRVSFDSVGRVSPAKPSLAWPGIFSSRHRNRALFLVVLLDINSHLRHSYIAMAILACMLLRNVMSTASLT